MTIKQAAEALEDAAVNTSFMKYLMLKNLEKQVKEHLSIIDREEINKAYKDVGSPRALETPVGVVTFTKRNPSTKYWDYPQEIQTLLDQVDEFKKDPVKKATYYKEKDQKGICFSASFS